MKRAPICKEIEAELQLRTGDGIKRIGRSHMFDTSRGGGKIDHTSPSSCVFNMGEDRNLFKWMDELEESMKLIVATLNIGGVDNQVTIKKTLKHLVKIVMRKTQ